MRFNQFQALEKSVEQDQIEEWRRLLAPRLPGSTEAEIWRHVKRAMERAHRYGVVEYRDFAAYIELCCELGFDFEDRSEYASVAQCLRTRRISSPSRRVEVARETWRRARAIQEQNRTKRAAFDLRA